MKSTRGFSMIELIAVMSIMGIIITAVLFRLTGIREDSRDTKRIADLRTLQSAIELYKQRWGRYPEGCNGPGAWSGQIGTNYACNRNNGIYAAYVGTGQYIIGHQAGAIFAPSFISVLPVDPKLRDAQSGYVYTTNTAGTVYKLMARRTVEGDSKLMSGTEGYTHQFKSCDATNSGTGMCDATDPTNNKPPHCQENDPIFTSTYAVWGGFANGADSLAVEQLTEDIICDIP